MLLAPLSIRERTIFSTVIILSVIFLAITTAGATNSLVGSYVYSPFSACDSSGGSWSAVLQATGLPEAELASNPQYGRTARIAEGAAPLICGQAHISHQAALNLGIRLHLATIGQVDDSQ